MVAHFRKAFTLVELMIALGIFSLVLIIVWNVMGTLLGSGKASVDTLTRHALLGGERIIATEKLYNRVQEGIEILAPLRGETSSALIFRDVLNQTVKLEVDSHTNRLVSKILVPGSANQWQDEEGAGTSQPDLINGTAFFPAPPIRVARVQQAEFTVHSPTCVSVLLEMVDGQAKLPLQLMIEVKNCGIVYQ